MITINPRTGVPLWEQIRDSIKSKILLGVWSAGEQIPSVRALATELGINPNTIARAISELEREGLVYTVAGKGAYVEEDLTLISLKRKTEAIEHLSKALLELKNADVGLETVINKVNEVYGKDNL